jgi:hypothetical protein
MVAENVCVEPPATVTAEGLTASPCAAVMLIVAVPVLVFEAESVAVMVTVAGLGTDAGAV